MSAGDELVVGQRGGPDGAVDEAWDQAGELEAAVVAPSEAAEIAAGMLGADAAVGAGDRGFDVAQRGVDPFESLLQNRALSCGTGPLGYGWRV